MNNGTLLSNSNTALDGDFSPAYIHQNLHMLPDINVWGLSSFHPYTFFISFFRSEILKCHRKGIPNVLWWDLTSGFHVFMGEYKDIRSFIYIAIYIYL